MLMNSSNRYGAVSIGLHWVTLLLMAAVYATIELHEIFPKGSDPREALKVWHFMLGFAVLLVATLRLSWRFITPAPRVQPAPPALQERLAGAVHVGLYLLMIGAPILGWLVLGAAGKPIPFFGLELPVLTGPDKGLAKGIKEVHEVIAKGGYLLIGLHAAAALFHHYFLRDDTLTRMLPERVRTTG